MGVIYLKDNPEAESFSYAYVENAYGELVRISLVSLINLLGNASGGGGGNTTVFLGEVTLPKANWVESEDGTYYTQNVVIEGVRSISKIDLQPTAVQIIQLMNEEITMFIANESDVTTAYSVNGIPSTDMTIKVAITEVN